MHTIGTKTIIYSVHLIARLIIVEDHISNRLLVLFPTGIGLSIISGRSLLAYLLRELVIVLLADTHIEVCLMCIIAA